MQFLQDVWTALGSLLSSDLRHKKHLQGLNCVLQALVSHQSAGSNCKHQNPLQAIDQEMQKRRDATAQKQWQQQQQHYSRCYAHYDPAYQAEQERQQWQNVQDELKAGPDALEELSSVEKMTQALLSALGEERTNLLAQKEVLNKKMDALASFALILDRFVSVSKQGM